MRRQGRSYLLCLDTSWMLQGLEGTFPQLHYSTTGQVHWGGWFSWRSLKRAIADSKTLDLLGWTTVLICKGKCYFLNPVTCSLAVGMSARAPPIHKYIRPVWQLPCSSIIQKGIQMPRIEQHNCLHFGSWLWSWAPPERWWILSIEGVQYLAGWGPVLHLLGICMLVHYADEI